MLPYPLCTIKVVLFLSHYQDIFLHCFQRTYARMFVTSIYPFFFANANTISVKETVVQCVSTKYAIQSTPFIAAATETARAKYNFTSRKSLHRTYWLYAIIYPHILYGWGFLLHRMHKPHTFSMMKRTAYTSINYSERINCQLCNFISNYLRSISLWVSAVVSILFTSFSRHSFELTKGWNLLKTLW